VMNQHFPQYIDIQEAINAATKDSESAGEKIPSSDLFVQNFGKYLLKQGYSPADVFRAANLAKQNFGQFQIQQTSLMPGSNKFALSIFDPWVASVNSQPQGIIESKRFIR